MFSKALLSWIALPVYVWQGLGVRRRTERLTPRRLPPEGRIEGSGEEMRLLCAGDSSVASIGMTELDETLTFNVAVELNRLTGRPVYWRAAGANSATAGDIRDHVIPHLDRRDFTHIVLVVGTNDVKNFHTVRRFKRQFGSLVYAARSRFPHAEIVWAPVADMTRVPALPAGLARILKLRADLLNAMGRQLCAERGLLVADPVPIEGPEGFARDGFHAGPDGYRTWARHLAAYFVPTQAEPSAEAEAGSHLERGGNDNDDEAGERQFPEITALS